MPDSMWSHSPRACTRPISRVAFTTPQGVSRPALSLGAFSVVECRKPRLNLVLKVHIRQSGAVEQYDLPLGLAEEAEDASSVEF
jgi:hypothetical protein